MIILEELVSKVYTIWNGDVNDPTKIVLFDDNASIESWIDAYDGEKTNYEFEYLGVIQTFGGRLSTTFNDRICKSIVEEIYPVGRNVLAVLIKYDDKKED